MGAVLVWRGGGCCDGLEAAPASAPEPAQAKIGVEDSAKGVGTDASMRVGMRGMDASHEDKTADEEAADGNDEDKTADEEAADGNAEDAGGVGALSSEQLDAPEAMQRAQVRAQAQAHASALASVQEACEAVERGFCAVVEEDEELRRREPKQMRGAC